MREKTVYIIIGIVIVFFTSVLSGCFQTSVFRGLKPFRYVSLSSDGKILLSISGGLNDISSITHNEDNNFEIIFWNTSTGVILRREQSISWQDIHLSPNGLYFINDNNKTITSLHLGKINSYTGFYQDWDKKNSFFITTEYNSLHFWDITNFTIYRTLTMNKSIWKASISPTGTMLALIFRLQNRSFFSMIDISQHQPVWLWNMTDKQIETPIWSENGKSIQFVQPQNSGNGSPQAYDFIILNATNGEILENHSIKSDLFISISFGKYLSDNYKNNTLTIYDFSRTERVIHYKYGPITRITWSQDGSTIASVRNECVIEIRNASTGELINALSIPLYENIYSLHPFYSLFIIPITIFIIVFVIAVIILTLKKRKKKQKL